MSEHKNMGNKPNRDYIKCKLQQDKKGVYSLVLPLWVVKSLSASKRDFICFEKVGENNEIVLSKFKEEGEDE